MKFTEEQLGAINKHIEDFIDSYIGIIGHCASTGVTKNTKYKMGALIIVGPNNAYVALDFDKRLITDVLTNDAKTTIRLALIEELESFSVKDTLDKYRGKYLIDEIEEPVVKEELKRDKRFFLDRADALKDIV